MTNDKPPAARQARLGLLLALLVAACGGGGGGGSGGSEPNPPSPIVATESDHFFPLGSAARWAYVVDGGQSAVVDRISGAQGASILVHSLDAQDASSDEVAYVAGPTGVKASAVPGSRLVARALDGADLMRWPARQGDTYVQADRVFEADEDLDGDGRNDRVAVRAELTVVGLEAVSVPAGTFADCLRQRQVIRLTILPAGGAAPTEITHTIDTWYARDVGRVRSVATTREGGADRTRGLALAAYRVGSTSSDSQAPSVGTYTPTTYLRPGLGTTVDVTFSEAMDPESLMQGGLRIIDLSGRTVPGEIRVTGNRARFTPAQPWADGGYVATLAGTVQDLAGNAIGTPLNWFFAADATAPGVYWSAPVANEESVPLSPVLVVTFGEVIDTSTAGPSSVQLYDGADPVAVTITALGPQILVEPKAALRPGTLHTLTVSGIKDSAGNTMASTFEISFRTTERQLAFATPEPFFPNLGVLAVAVDDVNGDGIPDTVFSFDNSAQAGRYSWVLYVRHGRPDGGFDPPQLVDTTPLQWCDLFGIATGDLNNDGRTDVAVGSLRCGTLVLLQDAGGTLRVSASFDPPSGSLRIVDVNHDGRLDLVGAAGEESPDIHIWLQQPDGQLSLSTTASLPGGYGRDVEVGDVNGDGRPDLVLTTEYPPGRQVAVFRQRADGTFEAPTFLTPDDGFDFYAWGVALGDVNGDGALDIVVATESLSHSGLSIYHQTPSGELGPETRMRGAKGSFSVRTADVNQDGRADVVLSHRGNWTVGVYLQRPDGTLATEERFDAPYGSGSLQSLAVGDLDRDGRVDVFLAGDRIRQLPPPSRPPSPAAAVRRVPGLVPHGVLPRR